MQMWAGSSERNFGGTCPTKWLWVLHRVWLWYPANSAAILAASYHSFRQGEGVANTMHNVVDFPPPPPPPPPKKMIWSLIPEVMFLVRIILVMPATNASSDTPSVHWKGWSLISAQPCWTTVSIILCHAQFIRSWWRNYFKQVTNDFVDRVEKHSSIFGHFST